MHKVKSVKFNLDIKRDNDLHTFASQKENFAGWVKDLIEKEMKKTTVPVYKSDQDGVIRIRIQ
ncbi:hypothetical protein ACFVAD_20245 [Sutcliffiella sp. NPDC057660]|uniref:hypothetical protein n=1 Tax=Sutcliffiella sp. NPDC057660 TaxID=3346199 RepID=UPI00369B1BCB